MTLSTIFTLLMARLAPFKILLAVCFALWIVLGVTGAVIRTSANKHDDAEKQSLAAKFSSFSKLALTVFLCVIFYGLLRILLSVIG